MIHQSPLKLFFTLFILLFFYSCHEDTNEDINFVINEISEWDIDYIEIIDERDNQKYKAVKIGSQYWMAENMNLDLPSGSTCAQNIMINCNIFGRLYNWSAARDICPKGWHLPSQFEWQTLIGYLGGMDEAWGKLMSNKHWRERIYHPANETGFSALPAGHISTSGSYGFGTRAYWWTSSEASVGSNRSFAYHLYPNNGYIGQENLEKTKYLSCRCVRD